MPDRRPLRALTLRPPWAWAVAELGKDVENRTWTPTHSQLREGEWFAIHGGVSPKSRPALAQVGREVRILLRSFAHLLPTGDCTLREVLGHAGIVAVARFGGCVQESESPWFHGPEGWTLAEVVKLPQPVACKGAQGLWIVPDRIVEQVRDGFRVTRAGSKGVLAHA